jgi:hypothetical protein
MSSSVPQTDQRPSRSPSPLLAQNTPVESSPNSESNSHYLHIPLRKPNYHRPSLDSTANSDISELSINSIELRHGLLLLQPSPHDNVDQLSSTSLRPAPYRRRCPGVRGYIDAFWLRNKGVLLVLLAMVFGSGMNVVARLMETDGSHGEAMHPFQVRTHSVNFHTSLFPDICG